jgi:hypothetical protein
MTNKKLRTHEKGTFNHNDKRTKLGKSKSSGTKAMYEQYDAVTGLIGGVFSSKGKPKKPSNAKKTNEKRVSSSYEEYVETEEEKTERLKKDKKALPFIIIGAIIGVGLVIWFWFWIVSLF